MNPIHYRTRILSSLSEAGQIAWDSLLELQGEGNPFLSYAFLHALHESGSACAASGWQPQYLTLWDESDLAAACPLYIKSHSYGEYVFDWAWADAYRRHGFDYYPKLLSAIPFTPVAGNRLLARDEVSRSALLGALCKLQEDNGLSSTHILFPTEYEATTLQQCGFLLRSSVQFHWLNPGYANFDEFLDSLERKKRKNIRAERRKAQDAGITFRHIRGKEATGADWHFFKHCYDRTYAAHASTPYLNTDFFLRIGESMPQHLLLVVAELDGQAIASSLVFHTDSVLYGRYWGTLANIPCLHFETAYYQPLEFCIAQGIQRFEGGAQGEHKLARGFLPHKTWSAHWLAQTDFADAVERFLAREQGGIDAYIDELGERNPFRSRNGAAKV